MRRTLEAARVVEVAALQHDDGLALAYLLEADAALLDTWGDTSVSSCRSYSRAKGPGASADAFPMTLSLSGE